MFSMYKGIYCAITAMSSNRMLNLVYYETKIMDKCFYMKDEVCSIYSINSGSSRSKILI